jgi:hypothetical protein
MLRPSDEVADRDLNRLRMPPSDTLPEHPLRGNDANGGLGHIIPCSRRRGSERPGGPTPRPWSLSVFTPPKEFSLFRKSSFEIGLRAKRAEHLDRLLQCDLGLLRMAEL